MTDINKLTNRRIEVTVHKTVGIGEYQFVKVGTTIGADVPDGDDIDEAFSELYSATADLNDEGIKDAVGRTDAS